MTHPALVVHPLICPIICESSFITNIISLAILGSWEMFGLGDVIGNAGRESVVVLYLHKFLWLSKDLMPIKSFFRIQIHVDIYFTKVKDVVNALTVLITLHRWTKWRRALLCRYISTAVSILSVDQEKNTRDKVIPLLCNFIQFPCPINTLQHG